MRKMMNEVRINLSTGMKTIDTEKLVRVTAAKGGYDPDAPALPCINCGAKDVTILGYSEWDKVVYKCNCCGQVFYIRKNGEIGPED